MEIFNNLMKTVIVLLILALVPAVIMLTWNWLVVYIFQLPPIDYGKGWGILFCYLMVRLGNYVTAGRNNPGTVYFPALVTPPNLTDNDN